MKKPILVLLVILISFTFLFSCKKSGITTNTSTSSLIVGKWYYVFDTVKTATNGGPLQLLIANSNYNHTEYWQFNSDGTGSNFYNSATRTFTYTIAGNIMTVNFPATVSGTTPVPASSENLTIRSVTSDKLALLSYEIQTISTTNTSTIYDAAYFTK